MADLGRAALIVAFGLALYAAVAGSIAAHEGRRRLHESSRNAIVGAFAATIVAALVLLDALHRRDFSFTYVGAHSVPLGDTGRSKLAGVWHPAGCALSA